LIDLLCGAERVCACVRVCLCVWPYDGYHVMLTRLQVILALGVLYEVLEHASKHRVPKNFRVVVDSMVNELAALGFVATVVNVYV
jgi:hypothetical protein